MEVMNNNVSDNVVESKDVSNDKILLQLKFDEFDTYRKNYNDIIHRVLDNPTVDKMRKCHQIQVILMEEFSNMFVDEKYEAIAKRIYDKVIS